MIYYDEKALLPYTDGEKLSITPMTILDVRCDCGRTWRLPVPQEYTDYRKVAEEYAKRYAFICGQITEYIRELEIEIGDLPSTRRTKALLLQLRQMVMEWHERDTRERDRLKGLGE